MGVNRNIETPAACCYLHDQRNGADCKPLLPQEGGAGGTWDHIIVFPSFEVSV